MNFNKITLSLFSLALLAGASACVEDSSLYGSGVVADLKVKVPTSDKMPVLNFNYGDECVIKPEVTYSGSDQLTYEWSVGSYEGEVRGELTKVSNEKELHYKFPKGGVYYAHLTVTDGKVGTVQEWRINMNRTFESGWTLISNNEQGIGNLSFVKDQTPEEIAAGMQPIVMEHSLEKINEGVKPEKLIGGVIIKMSWPEEMTRLCISTETKGYYLDPNNFTALSTIDYSSVAPGFKAKYLLGDAANPMVSDYNSGQWITLESQNMFGYLPEQWKGQKMEYVFSGSYSAWGNINFVHAFIKSVKPLVVANYSSYYSYSGLPDIVDSSKLNWQNKPCFENEELITAFLEEPVPVGQWQVDTYYTYILTRNTVTGKVYSNLIDNFGSYSTTFDFIQKEEVEAEGKVLPTAMSAIATSKTYHRKYFYNGNKVYVMLSAGKTYSLPAPEQASLTFPAGEEVTYIAINEVDDKEQLCVATYNKSTGRGSFYVYDPANVRTDNPNAAPLHKYLNCADRITNAFYKPRIEK